MKTLPRLNASYWALMLLCTTMGELIGNLLSRNFELGYTQGAILDVCIFGITIFCFLAFKLKNQILNLYFNQLHDSTSHNGRTS